MKQKKRLILSILPLGTGVIIKMLNSFWNQQYAMSDFMRGFFDGLSIVLMVVGLILIGFCLGSYFKSKEN